MNDELLLAAVVKISVFELVTLVNVLASSSEYAIVSLVELPQTTQLSPFQLIPLTVVAKVVFPNPVQLIPSVDLANVLVPLPQSNNLIPLK